MSAFEANFSDFKIVRTRGVAQFVFEVDLRQADAALRVLGGVPQPEAEQRVGIAPMKAAPATPLAEAAPETGKITRLDARKVGPWHTLSRAQQAGILCQDADFMAWRNDRYTPAVTDAEGLASAIRAICRVSSRRELDTDEAAGKRWDRLVDAFRGRNQEARYAR